MKTDLRRGAHLAYRVVRTGLLLAAGPLDRSALLLNGKRGYAPIHLRRHVGPLEGFERTPGEFAGALAAYRVLRPGARVLDVGCGVGNLGDAILGRLGPDGRYRGFDVHRGAIRWASKHRTDPRSSFVHHDYWNATYNRTGMRFLPMPVEDGWADVVVAKSVITHMLPEDVAFYMREVARVLAPGGSAFVTAYCFAGGEDVTAAFPHGDGRYRYLRPASPESAIALPKDWLAAELAVAGIEATYLPGLWRGTDAPAVTEQDLFVMRHVESLDPREEGDRVA